MPTYQYACTACNHQLEAVQSFTDDPLTQCPVCDGRLRKLFGAVGIVFKGSGFYRTDSRSASNGNGNEASKPSADGKDSKDSKDGKGSKGSKDSKGGKDSSGSKDKTTAGEKATATTS